MAAQSQDMVSQRLDMAAHAMGLVPQNLNMRQHEVDMVSHGAGYGIEHM